jgi:hypothetical protein
MKLEKFTAAPAGDVQWQLQSQLRLPEDAGILRARYQRAKPFPHLILDNLFPEPVLDAVLAETPQLGLESWVYFDKPGLQKVLRMRGSSQLGPASFQLAAFLHCPTFLYALSELTGIWQLLPDPYLQGAGHALMRRGMYFKVHSDRNIAYDTGLRRRLAMIIFLNRDWRSEYAGELELWNHAGTQCEVSIAPSFNRTVLFEVADPNFHGVPAPLNCPPERARQSFIVYYHTADQAGEPPAPHTSVFAPSMYRTRGVRLRQLAEDCMPPVLWRALKRMLGRGL